MRRIKANPVQVKKNWKHLISKNAKERRARGDIQVIQYLPSMCKP
jgi:hypothetical protein